MSQETAGRGYLTFSIDDGHATDFRSADLLARFGLKATFYVPATNPERPAISAADVRRLSEGFEIGSHTYNHKPLKGLPAAEAEREIRDGKKWVEDAIGKAAPSFCYPRGKIDRQAVALARKVGFTGARTCFFNRSDVPKNPYLWGVSTHAYDHSPAVQVRHALLEKNFAGARDFLTVHRLARDWETHFLRAVDHVERVGGVAHLFFHSWEIEDLGQWGRLERLLATLSRRTALTRATNGEIFELRQ